MPEETPPAQPQAGGADPIDPQGQVPTTLQADPQAGEPQKPQKSAEEYERMITELRKEAAGHRLKLKKFEDEEAKRLEAQMTEQQKLEKRVADLQKAHDDALRTHQEYRINAEVRLQATQLGFANVEDATRLLDWTQIAYGDDGTPENVQALLKDLLKTKPYLAGSKATPVTSGGATNPPRSQSSGPPALSWEVIGRMTAQEYAARQPEIQQFMRDNPPRFGRPLGH